MFYLKNDLPELDNILSERVRNFLVYLYDSRPFGPTFIYFRLIFSYLFLKFVFFFNFNFNFNIKVRTVVKVNYSFNI